MSIPQRRAQPYKVRPSRHASPCIIYHTEQLYHGGLHLMAYPSNGSWLLNRLSSTLLATPRCLLSPHARPRASHVAALARSYSHGPNSEAGPFRYRLRTALRKTKIEWRPIPVTLGIGFLGLVQFYRIQRREKARQDEEEEEELNRQRPAKRKRVRPSGPWYGSCFMFLSCCFWSKS